MQESNSSIRGLAGLNILFGIWLIISPYLLSYDTAQAKWQQTIAGIVIAVLAFVRYVAPSQVWTSVVNAIIGLWMILAPFVTNYQATAAYWNEVIFGILVALTAAMNASSHNTGQQHHGSPSAV